MPLICNEIIFTQANINQMESVHAAVLALPSPEIMTVNEGEKYDLKRFLLTR